MKFLNTQPPVETKGFKDIIFNSLATNKSLFVPETLPQLSKDFIQSLGTLTSAEIGLEVLFPFMKEDLTKEELKLILEEALNFDLPMVSIHDSIGVLELFHGPTQAFKDVGARVMARLLSALKPENQEITILAATSGDTGSAVANGFYEVPGIKVVLLFPKGMVSPYQEHQMTSLGKNIKALEVEGTFDDCQALVKQAFNDQALNEQVNLSSANSINLARLLPQMIYYFYSFGRLTPDQQKAAVYCVPSGNLGNITAGLYAKAMGLPIKRFIAAENSNDSFHRYLQDFHYEPRKTFATYSNAMDVGAPSNFERIVHLFAEDREALKNAMGSDSITDEETLLTIQKVKKETGYTLDPHGAVGYTALQNQLQADEYGVLLETAHPFKFEPVMKKALPDFQVPLVDLSQCKKKTIPSSYQDFRNELVD